MSRLRVTLVSSLLVMGLALASFQSFAQQPGGGGGRGGRGGGPGGGPGGWGGGPGGPGGPGGGGDILNLLSNAAVQEEIKLKEAQKVKITTLTEQSKQQRQKIQTMMNEARQNAQNQNGGNQGGQNNGNNQQQGGGGRGGRGRQMDPETQELFATMRQQINEVQNYVENSVAKILDKNQLARVKQIQVQLDSPQNLFREDMMDKLQINEEQQAMMAEVRDENRTLQRESGQGRRELMRAAMESMPQVQANNNNGGGGGRGGRGGAFNDPAVREAMQKYLEKPEVKAKMDQFRTAEEKLQDQYTNALLRVLTKRQLAIYKKMLGAPFDLSKIRGGGPGRGPWNAPNRNAAVVKGQGTAPATANATSKTASSTTPESTGTTATTIDKPATDAAKTKRKNALRAARGLDD